MKIITVTYNQHGSEWGYVIVKDNIRVVSEGYTDLKIAKKAAADNLKALKNNHKIVEYCPTIDNALK